MTVLRITINNESLIDNKWLMTDGIEEIGSGESSFLDILALDGYTSIEIYLSPFLASIFRVNIAHISDKKINDDLLLGLVEDNLVEDLESCKPLLMRLSEGDSFIAVLNKSFYEHLINSLSDYVKLVKFIQPISYLTAFEEDKWTVYLSGGSNFVRTSQFEYYLLDDSDFIPETLEMMLDSYEKDSLIIYCDNLDLVESIQTKYKLLCQVETELKYGNLVWNFYNEKTKKFNYKITSDNKQSLIKSSKMLGVVALLYVLVWSIDFAYLLVEKYRLQAQVTKTLTGLIKVDSYQSSLLGKVNDQLNGLAHSKGYYAASDFPFLMSMFLQNMPEVNQSMIVGVKYSTNELTIFLNSQFKDTDIENYAEILRTKKIAMSVSDYTAYQSSQQDEGTKNGGGLLDDDNSKEQKMQNAQWVVSLQEINIVELSK